MKLQMVVQVCSNDDATYIMLMVIFKHQFSGGSSSRSYQDKNSPEQMSKKHNDSDDTHLDLESSSAVWLGACIS